MDPRIKDLLRLIFVGLLLLVGGAVVAKHYRIYQEKNELVEAMRTATSEASFYRQFDRAGAERVLLRSVALVEDARALGLPPEELFDRVYDREKSDQARSSERYPAREKLVRRSLDHAHRAAEQLGLLEPAALGSLRQGKMPRVSDGRPTILPLIDPELSPGLGRIVPNLEIHPPGTDASARELDAIEVAAARQLARDLASAGLIEGAVADEILENYRTIKPRGDDD